MLAYLSWHRPATGVRQADYEHALERFHRSLAHQPPSGFRGSVALRLGELPWPVDQPAGEPSGPAGYEDWYLLDDWSAVGVLEEATVGRGHATAHDAVAGRAGLAAGSIYRLLEGSPKAAAASLAVWVAHQPRRDHPSLGDLLGDGIDPRRDALWRRCLGLGPAPEYCLLAAEAAPGVADSRLPAGWTSRAIAREVVWGSADG
jgi:hypothetical protein